jgi:hypothetical protein
MMAVMAMVAMANPALVPRPASLVHEALARPGPARPAPLRPSVGPPPARRRADKLPLARVVVLKQLLPALGGQAAAACARRPSINPKAAACARRPRRLPFALAPRGARKAQHATALGVPWPLSLPCSSTPSIPPLLLHTRHPSPAPPHPSSLGPLPSVRCGPGPFRQGRSHSESDRAPTRAGRAFLPRRHTGLAFPLFPPFLPSSPRASWRHRAPPLGTLEENAWRAQPRERSSTRTEQHPHGGARSDETRSPSW